MKNILIVVLNLILSPALFGQAKEIKFNHFYVVVDSVTFQRIKQSEKLDALVNIDKGLPHFEPIDSLSTTVYIRGKNTYIEIMGPTNKFKEKVGAIGLGFSWDSNNLNDTLLESRIRPASDIKFENYITSRKFDETNVPWFKTYYTKLDGHIATWYSFYYPQFLTRLNHKTYTSFKRSYYLENAYNEQKDVVDLTEIELTCDQKDYQKIVQELDSFYTNAKQVKGNTTTYAMDGVNLILHLVDDQSRIVRFNLQGKKERPTKLILGNLSVKSSKKEFIFEFNGYSN